MRWSELGGLTEEKITVRPLAAEMKRPHSFVAATETGERRLDVVEFFDFATAWGSIL